MFDNLKESEKEIIIELIQDYFDYLSVIQNDFQLINLSEDCIGENDMLQKETNIIKKLNENTNLINVLKSVGINVSGVVKNV